MDDSQASVEAKFTESQMPGGMSDILDKIMGASKSARPDDGEAESGDSESDTGEVNRDSIRAEIEKLTPNSNADDWHPIVERIAMLDDLSFDAEALDRICAKTGKKLKATLGKQIEKLRRQAKSKKGSGTEDPGHRARSGNSSAKLVLDNWDLRGRSHDETCHEVIDALVTANAEQPRLFSMGQGPSRAVHDPITGQITLEPLNFASMRQEIGTAVRFGRTKTNKSGQAYFQDLPVPESIASHIVNTPDLGLPPLKGVTDVPFFDRNGELVYKPGYHAESRKLYRPPAGFELDPIPVVPTIDDVREANRRLDEVIQDFPFDDGTDDPSGASSRAHYKAKLLQTPARELIGEEPCPAYLTFKHAPRTGASLLTQSHSLIIFGCHAKIETQKESPEEYQKTILTHLKIGSPHIVFDNLTKPLDDPTITALLTSYWYSGRELGANRQISASWDGVLDLNGNNSALSLDLIGRSLLIRLDAQMENPGTRDAAMFRHSPLLPWVKANRARFVWAVLVLIQNWVARGMPRWRGRALGGFESYSQVMGGILEAAGIDGFMGNQKLLRASAGVQTDVSKGFVELWCKQFGDAQTMIGSLQGNATATTYIAQPDCDEPPLEVKTLVELLLVNADECDLGFNGWSKGSWQRGMGAWLREHKGRVFDLAIDQKQVRVRVRYEKPEGSGVRAWLERLTS